MSEPYQDHLNWLAGENEPDDVPEEERPTDEDLSDIVRRHKEEACEECHGSGQVPISELALAIRDLTKACYPNVNTGNARTWRCLGCNGTGKTPQPELAEVLETLHIEQRDWEQQYNWRMAS